MIETLERNETYTCCAKIENNIVVQAIVCSSVEWAIERIGGEWLPIYNDNPAGIGYTWDGEKFNPPLTDPIEEE